MSRNKILIYILLFFSFLSNLAEAQKKRTKNKEVVELGEPSEEDDRFKKSPEYIKQFKNIGKVSHYKDLKLLSSIKLAEKNNDYTGLLKNLELYVFNFGVDNFYKDIDLLWKLAQLYEKLGRNEESLYLYRIILKHHRGNIDLDKIKLHYDSAMVNDEERYIPLKHYYDLVEYRRAVDTLLPPRGVFLNMGHAINSKSEDYAPSLNFEATKMIFSTKRNKKGVNFVSNEDIYFSIKDAAGWDDAKPMSELNSPYNEGSACLNKDGTAIFFARCEAPGGLGNCDIYVSYVKEDSTWTSPQNLGSAINSGSWDSQPALSHTEDTLYFASDRLGGFGLSDIYYSVKDKVTKKWLPAKNIGPVINTRENEVSPFYHPVFDVLYFSSTGHLLRFGGFDIYKSLSKHGIWTDPKSIGPLVNGKGDEYYFTIDSKAKDLYYARSELTNMKNLDLFSFPLPMEARPDAVTHFEGALVDSATGNPFKGIVSMIDLSNGVEIAPKFLRPDGSYEFDLINNNNYLLVIQGEDFFRVEKKIQLNGDTTIKIQTPSIKFKRLQFHSIIFKNGSSEVNEEMKPDLDKLFNYLIDNIEVKLTISGHTDSDGDPQANLLLSQKRADAIKTYLITNDLVDSVRIEAIGHGSTKPIIKNEKSEEDKKVNRRVEFEIIKPEELIEGN